MTPDLQALAKLEQAGYILILKTFKGRYPLTICSLTHKGPSAFDGYVQKIRMVANTAADGNGHKTQIRMRS